MAKGQSSGRFWRYLGDYADTADFATFVAARDESVDLVTALPICVVVVWLRRKRAKPRSAAQ